MFFGHHFHERSLTKAPLHKPQNRTITMQRKVPKKFILSCGSGRFGRIMRQQQRRSSMESLWGIIIFIFILSTSQEGNDSTSKDISSAESEATDAAGFEQVAWRNEHGKATRRGGGQETFEYFSSAGTGTLAMFTTAAKSSQSLYWR